MCFRRDRDDACHESRRAAVCFDGADELPGKCHEHRKAWIEVLLRHFARCFGIDLLTFAILSNHFQLVLHDRADVVADTQVNGDSAIGNEPPSSLAAFELTGTSWMKLALKFGQLFYLGAGMPHTIDQTRTRQTDRPVRMRQQTREALARSA